VAAIEQYPKGLGPLVTAIRELLPEGAVAAKTRFSSVSAKSLIELPGSDRAQVVIVGVEAHVCVLQTALDLYHEWKEVYIVADCVGSRRHADRDLAIARMRQEAFALPRAKWSCSNGSERRTLPCSGPSARNSSSDPELMNLLAILLALGLEQWRAFRWRGGVQHAFDRYARFLERRFNAGTEQQGALTALLAVGPPVVLAAAGYWALDALHPLLGLAWNTAILYLLVGFRHFSHAFTAIGEALRAGDAITAHKRLVAWRGAEASAATAEEIPKLAIEQGIEDSYRHVFGT